MVRSPVALIALAGLALAAPAAGGNRTSLGEIRAHLFYKGSGQLSEDIVSRDPPFIAWNTVIGGGDAKEAADDILILLPVRAEGEVFSDDPVHLWVVDGDGKELARRSFGSTLTSPQGTEHKALWLRDATCVGEMTVHAALRGEARVARLTFHCGE